MLDRGPSDDDHGGSARMGRRRLVLGAAAGVVAAVVQHGTTAQAADGGNVILGQANSATSSTRIVASGATYAFEVEATSGYGFGVHGIGTAYGVHGEADGYAGVFGDTSGSSAVGVVGYNRASAGPGVGVSGAALSPAGTGVVGAAPAIGVRGIALGSGLSPSPPAGTVGVCGQAAGRDGLGGWFGGSRAAVRLVPDPAAGAPSTGTHEIGDLVVDSGGRVFVCTAAGTPGRWNELGAATAGPAAAQPTLRLLPTPERFVDTRDGTGGVRGPIAAGTTRTFTLTGQDGLSGNPALQVPDSAVYAVGNLAAIGADAAELGSFLALWPSGPRPPVASINFGPARTLGAVSNSVLVNLADHGGGHRGFQIFNNAACDYVIDVTGYYELA